MIGGIPHEKVFPPRFPGGGFELSVEDEDVERWKREEGETENSGKCVGVGGSTTGLLWPSWVRLREGGTRVV